jgi:hypothetical protein
MTVVYRKFYFILPVALNFIILVFTVNELLLKAPLKSNKNFYFSRTHTFFVYFSGMSSFDDDNVFSNTYSKGVLKETSQI